MTTLVSDPSAPGASIVPPPVAMPSGATIQPSDISRDEQMPYTGRSPFIPGSITQIAAVPETAPDLPADNAPHKVTDPRDLAADALARKQVGAPEPHALAADYLSRRGDIEGYGVKDPNSSAVSGFIDSTWLDQVRKIRPDLRGVPDDQVLALRYDKSEAGKALINQAAAHYASENAGVLKNAGQPVTPTTVRLADLLGPQGAIQALTANPNAKFSELNPKAAAANPTLADRTVGEVIQLANAQATGTTRADLMRTSTGPFNAGAMPLLQEWQSDLARKSKEYDAALAEGKDLRTVARAAMKKWEYETDHPPQDMRESWNQWAAGAIGLALIGGFFGRNHTAAINAAGEMLQAANAADVRAYDIAYKKWKDHNDNGLKMIELLHGEARDVINDAKNSYDMTVTKLATLSTMYHLGQAMDPQSLENQERQVRIAAQNARIIEQQHDYAKKKLEEDQLNAAIEQKGKRWLAEHPEANGVIPPDVRLQLEGQAKREVSGTASAASDAIKQQVYTNTLAAEVKQWLDKPENAGKTTSDIPPNEMADMQRRAGTASGYISPAAERAASDPKLQTAAAFKEKIRAEKGREPNYDEWVKFSQETGRSQTGQLSPEAVKLLAKQFEMGDPGAITSMPRSGPARVQIENQIAEDMKEMPDASRQIVMNRMRMEEARSAARSAGRITMNTELYVQAAAGAGKLVIDASKVFPRTNIPPVNAALAAFERNTGDPNIIKFGAAINALMNEYGKMSNPTGTGIHDADKARLANILDTSLSQGQVEGAIDMIVKEGRNISDAAMKAQQEVLSGLVPAQPGQSAAAAPTPAGVIIQNGWRYDATTHQPLGPAQ